MEDLTILTKQYVKNKFLGKFAIKVLQFPTTLGWGRSLFPRWRLRPCSIVKYIPQVGHSKILLDPGMLTLTTVPRLITLLAWLDWDCLVPKKSTILGWLCKEIILKITSGGFGCWSLSSITPCSSCYSTTALVLPNEALSNSGIWLVPFLY